MSQIFLWNPELGGHPASVELSALLPSGPSWHCCPLKSPAEISFSLQNAPLALMQLIQALLLRSSREAPIYVNTKLTRKGFRPVCGRLWLYLLGSAHGRVGAQGSSLQHVDMLWSSSSLPWHSPS